MFKRHKEINRKVDELVIELYEVEGEITDYLTHYIFDDFKKIRNEKFKANKFEKNVCGYQIIKALSEEGCEDLLGFDDDWSYQHVIFEVITQTGSKHYFETLLRDIKFHCGDRVRVFARQNEKSRYYKAYMIIDNNNQIITLDYSFGQGKIEALKSGFFTTVKAMLLLSFFLLPIFLLVLCLTEIFEEELSFLISFFIYLNITIFIIGFLIVLKWWFFPTQEGYHSIILAEAVFKKMGFNSVEYLDISKYSLLNYNKKNNVKMSFYEEQRYQEIYLIDLALKEHNQKYKK